MPGWDDLYVDPSSFWYQVMLRSPHAITVRWVQHLRDAGLKRVCDQGCGLGRHAVWLAGLGLEVVATDVSPRALAATRRALADRGLHGHVLAADMRSIPFPDASFDAVLSIGVLEHGTRRDLVRAIGEIRRVLRPGGGVLASFTSRGRWIPKDKPGMLEDNTRACYGPEQLPHHFVDEAELRDLFAAFTIQSIEPVREEFVPDAWAAELYLAAIKPDAR